MSERDVQGHHCDDERCWCNPVAPAPGPTGTAGGPNLQLAAAFVVALWYEGVRSEPMIHAMYRLRAAAAGAAPGEEPYEAHTPECQQQAEGAASEGESPRCICGAFDRWRAAAPASPAVREAAQLRATLKYVQDIAFDWLHTEPRETDVADIVRIHDAARAALAAEGERPA